MLRLKFHSVFGSILKFNEIVLPQLSVVTGLNGCGKSHFISAVRDGNIQAETENGERIETQEVLALDWNIGQHLRSAGSPQDRFSPSDTFSVEKFRKWVEEYRKAVDSIFDSIDPDLKIVLVEHAPLFTLGYIPPDCPLRNDPRFHASFKELSDATLELEQRIEKRFGFDALHNVRNKLLSPPQTLMTIPTNEVLEALVPDRTGRLFQTSIEVAVNQYLGKYRGLKREAQETWWKTGHASRDLQTDFQSTLGLAPWTVLNNAYEAAGLDLRIAPPELDGTDLFKLEFTRGANVKVNLGALSSGEQVAAAIGVGLYQSQPGSLRPLTPKLLLLDEIDAPLHPQLTRQVLTLLEELAKRLDMCVVMTTHSPTTVALAGKDAIFEKLPGRGLKKIAKGKALNLLLTGVPALALDFEGQRQVFVEAPSDAKVFSTLYQQMRAKLPSERSLDFISAGTRDAQTGNEEGGGCANAKRIVKSLVKNGNTSVFGLVDWDRGKNRPTPRIVVLGSGSRYSIENFVFDPLLLAAAICRDCPSFAPQIGIPSHVGLPELQKYTPGELQGIVDKVQAAVLGACSPDKKARYEGGFEIYLDARCLTMNGHDWARLCVERLTCLNGLAKHFEGERALPEITDALVLKVMRDAPKFVPVEIRESFETLLNKPLR